MNRIILFQMVSWFLITTSLVGITLPIQSISAQAQAANNSLNIDHQADSSPEVAIIIITADKLGDTVFAPNSTTINSGEEIIILNNATAVHSFTNGEGKNDPMSGKLFDTGNLNPQEFTEYTASNLPAGKYPFYSTFDETLKGELIIK